MGSARFVASSLSLDECVCVCVDGRFLVDYSLPFLSHADRTKRQQRRQAQRRGRNTQTWSPGVSLSFCTFLFFFYFFFLWHPTRDNLKTHSTYITVRNRAGVPLILFSSLSFFLFLERETRIGLDIPPGEPF